MGVCFVLLFMGWVLDLSFGTYAKEKQESTYTAKTEKEGSGPLKMISSVVGNILKSTPLSGQDDSQSVYDALGSNSIDSASDTTQTGTVSQYDFVEQRSLNTEGGQ